MKIEKELLDAIAATCKEAMKNNVSEFDKMVEDKLKQVINGEVATEVRKQVELLRVQRAIFGKDKTGLSKDQKKDFAKSIKTFLAGNMKTSALIEDQDVSGGFLVSAEVADAILRVAASVGIVTNAATKWPMMKDELDIPAYTGAYLTGAYIGADVSSVIQGLVFNQARLLAKEWQIAFAIGNALLNDASIELADWLIAFSGEALANMMDRQGLTGGSNTGDPFVGILNHQTVQVYTLPSGESGFSKYQVVDDSAAVIAQLEESILPGTGFFMHRSVWGALRAQQDAAGNYLLPWAGAKTVLEIDPESMGGPRPVGDILGYPVYTSRHMPALGSSAASTKFMIYGNLAAGLAWGEREAMSINKFTSGTFGNGEIALKNQTAIVMRNRHAITVSLPTAMTVVKTSA